ncbi:Ntn hydrolase family protein [Schinkia azotoformans]|uniref:hypothetical protein n=1 Tax=Schinkia azotoformans TaxID=1454 RepID=UPI002DB5B797|nr:hypothetical protein [Schinkia azotoformans]MEC1768279.1 hypothetical protein [Schinkia azotoformans]
MSLCFAMNFGDCVIIAGDGRLTERVNKTTVAEDHQKLSPITNNMVLYTSGIQDIAEMVRNDVCQSIKEGTSQEVSNLLTNISQHYHEKVTNQFPELFQSENDTSTGSVLACFENKKPFFIDFASRDGFKPLVCEKLGDMGFRGIGQSEAREYFARKFNKIHVGMNIADLLLDTYSYISSLYGEVGGKLRIYYVHKDGVNLLREGMIHQC